jgi:hypothetical protein
MSNLNKQPRIWRSVILPGNERIILSVRFENGEKFSSLADINHNIFRLDAEGKVVWQVQRDEQGKIDWDRWHKIAQKNNDTSDHLPFEGLLLIYPDGRIKGMNHETGCAPDVVEWEPECVLTTSCDGWLYEVDINTGLAKNITEMPRGRSW